MALTEETGTKKTPSLIVQFGLLAGLTLVAIGMGWLTGGSLVNETVSEKPAIETGGTGDSQGEQDAAGNAALSVIALDPITTNLAAPSSIWVRVELSLVFDGPPDAALAQTIHQDFLAYLRTVKLSQVESASGFQHLKTDLAERADIRSEGRVRQVLIKTLLFE